MPEHDPRPCSRRVFDVYLEEVWTRCVPIEPRRLAAALGQCIDQMSISRADIQDRTGWSDRLEANGQLAPSPAKHTVAQSAKPTGRRSIPSGVSVRELFWRGPRVRRSNAASRATRASAQAIGLISQLCTAPGTGLIKGYGSLPAFLNVAPNEFLAVGLEDFVDLVQ